MSKLDELYTRLLQVGFLVLREAAESGDSGWLTAELDLLHNIPSLIGEVNSERHLYFWNEERAAYLDWLAQTGTSLAQSRMRIYYEPLWNEFDDQWIEEGKADHVLL